MDKKKVKIIDAKRDGDYICVWVKIDDKEIQIVSRDEKLLGLIGKEVYLSKFAGKDYKFEQIIK
jgi:hypothetical protein